MQNAIVIFGSNQQTGAPQMGASDRAAIGLAMARFSGRVKGFCPGRDLLAVNYGAAAGISRLAWLQLSVDLDYDVALVGMGALAQHGDKLAGIIAERKNATLVFDVLDFHFEDSTLKIIKDAGRGNREEWAVVGPVVLVISADAVRPSYVSRYRRQMAAHVELNDTKAGSGAPPLNHAADWKAVRPRAKLGRRAQSWTGQAEDRMSTAFGIVAVVSSDANDRLIIADPATCADHLLRYLAHQGLLPTAVAKSFSERQNISEIVRPSKQTTDAESLRKVLVTLRASRGPRTRDDTSHRLARSPRNASAPTDELAKNAQQGRRLPTFGLPNERSDAQPTPDELTPFSQGKESRYQLI
jgi:hypothetical protein